MDTRSGKRPEDRQNFRAAQLQEMEVEFADLGFNFNDRLSSQELQDLARKLELNIRNYRGKKGPLKGDFLFEVEMYYAHRRKQASKQPKEYLHPEFEVRGKTKSYIRQILTQHGIKYTEDDTPVVIGDATCDQLYKLFADYIVDMRREVGYVTSTQPNPAVQPITSGLQDMRMKVDRPRTSAGASATDSELYSVTPPRPSRHRPPPTLEDVSMPTAGAASTSAFAAAGPGSSARRAQSQAPPPFPPQRQVHASRAYSQPPDSRGLPQQPSTAPSMYSALPAPQFGSPSQLANAPQFGPHSQQANIGLNGAMQAPQGMPFTSYAVQPDLSSFANPTTGAPEVAPQGTSIFSSANMDTGSQPPQPAHPPVAPHGSSHFSSTNPDAGSQPPQPVHRPVASLPVLQLSDRKKDRFLKLANSTFTTMLQGVDSGDLQMILHALTELKAEFEDELGMACHDTVPQDFSNVRRPGPRTAQMLIAEIERYGVAVLEGIFASRLSEAIAELEGLQGLLKEEYGFT